MLNFIFLSLSLIILSSCAHHKDVRPGANNKHTVAVKAESKEKGSRDAIAQATNYCKSRDSHVGIISEDHTYNNPNMDEQTYNNSQTIKDVATIFAGGSAEGAKAKHAADTALGKAYQTKITFECN